MDGESVDMLGNYRNGDQESFDLNVTENGDYQFTIQYSSKPGETDEPKLELYIFDKDAYAEGADASQAEWSATLDCKDAYNHWSHFKTAVLDNVNLTKGSKVLLINYVELISNKYTVNILNMGFSLNGDFGSNGVENVEVKAPAARKAYNVLGVEVAPDAKGLIIFSDGEKVFNK